MFVIFFFFRALCKNKHKKNNLFLTKLRLYKIFYFYEKKKKLKIIFDLKKKK